MPCGRCSTIWRTSIHIFADNAKPLERKLNLLGMIIKFIMPFICQLTCHDSSQPLEKKARKRGRHAERRDGNQENCNR